VSPTLWRLPGSRAATRRACSRGDAAGPRQGGGRGTPLARTASEAEQHAAHGLAWLATYVEAVRELAAYAERLDQEDRLGETEALLVGIGLGEYLDQIWSGIPMSQGEIVRPAGARPAGPRRRRVPQRRRRHPDRGRQHAREPRPARRAHPGGARRSDRRGCRTGRTLEAIRSEMRRFGEAEVAPSRPWVAPRQRLHPDRGVGRNGGARRLRPHHPGRVRRARALEGLDVRRLGRAVAGLYRGRLARAPAPRSRPNSFSAAARRRKRREYLPGIAAGDILPTAVFTEPNTGSISPRSGPARRGRGILTGSKATRHGSPTRSAPT
jgi:(2S)-methylsuccinyl-CoA dehydrogenase